MAFNVEAIAAAAKEANTTYVALNHDSLDGSNGWHAWDTVTANEVTVHAYSGEKAAEYLRLLMAGMEGL